MMTEKKNKASTVASAITIARLHYNRAIRHGVVSSSDSPFPNYKAPRIERPERTKLTADQVQAIEALDLGVAGPKGAGLAKVRDWFLFSLYAQGMRFSDVVQLRRSDVVRTEAGEDDDGELYLTLLQQGQVLAIVPEPSTLGLVALASVALLRRRK